jgi:hypothetical protein
MTLGWAGALTQQHDRIAARSGVEVFTAKTSDACVQMLEAWQRGHPRRQIVRVSQSPSPLGTAP